MEGHRTSQGGIGAMDPAPSLQFFTTFPLTLLPPGWGAPWLSPMGTLGSEWTLVHTEDSQHVSSQQESSSCVHYGTAAQIKKALMALPCQRRGVALLLNAQAASCSSSFCSSGLP